MIRFRNVTPEQIGKVMYIEFALGNIRMTPGDIFDNENINTAMKLRYIWSYTWREKYKRLELIMQETLVQITC